jgi:hypothetical protein
MEEIEGVFFGAGRKNERSWIAIESKGERVFFSYPDEIPLEIRKLKRGDEVRVSYEEKQGKKGSYKLLKEIELVKRKKSDDKERYARYRKYQVEVLQECYEDAKGVTSEEEDALLIAAAFFDKRCTPLAYYE